MKKRIQLWVGVTAALIFAGSAGAQNGAGYSGPSQKGKSIPISSSKLYTPQQLIDTQNRCFTPIYEEALESVIKFYGINLDARKDMEVTYRDKEVYFWAHSKTKVPTLEDPSKEAYLSVTVIRPHYSQHEKRIMMEVRFLPDLKTAWSGTTLIEMESRSPYYSYELIDDGTYNELGERVQENFKVKNLKISFGEYSRIPDQTFFVNSKTNQETAITVDNVKLANCMKYVY